MTLKTYQAFSMAQALAAVKRDLGADAVILNTRTFWRRRMLGLLRRSIIEVTATPAEQEARGRGAGAPQRPKGHAAARRAYAEHATGGTGDDRQRTKTLALALDEVHKRQAAEQSPGSTVVEAKRQASSPPPATAEKPTVASAPAARRFVLAAPDSDRNRIIQSDPVVGPLDEPPAVSRAMQDELSAIKTMVGQVLQRQIASHGAPPAPSMPKQLFEFYLRLIGQDISDDLADQIVNEVRDELSGSELEDETTVRAAVRRKLAGLIPVAQYAVPEHAPDGRPLTIALIGPTGVGKTTTLAKLAAAFKLRHERSVGLITCDTYRIAAVEQLRTYANIIGLPLQVASSPSTMQQAIAALGDCDVVLIDTAGRSQNDAGRLEELKSFISAASPHEVHLVLSSTAGEKVLLHEAGAFAEVGIHKIVLTKLDEAVSFGMLVNVIREVGKQLSFVTTGQEVPTHLEIGRADRLADLVLGGALSA